MTGRAGTDSAGGAVNLALGRPASQSSTWSDGVCGSAEAARAVDGDRNGNHNGGGCTVAITNADPQAWWQVDLQGVHQVDRVELWNRTDGWGFRLQDFDMRVSADGLVWTDFFHPGPAGDALSVAVNLPARYVRVQLRGADYLQLAEVEVYGAEPPSGTPGETATPTTTATATPIPTPTATATPT